MNADRKMIVPGEFIQLNELVSRITAPNPGMMTGPGTNAYIIGRDDLALIDPGPESDVHHSALLKVVGNRLKWILCTHTHRDHSPGARALKAATGAQVLGFAPTPDDGRQDTTFAPDRALRDGDVIDCGAFRLRAVHTPGHASNHLCYLLEEQKLLFTGDHVMQGSTVVISPPDGDMQAYLDSLDVLSAACEEHQLEFILPAHGYVIGGFDGEAPKAIARLKAHRLQREAKIVQAMQTQPHCTLDDWVAQVYDDVPPRMWPVAKRSLMAHVARIEAALS